MSDSGSNAFIDAALQIKATQQGPLTGLTFAAKDLFDVSQNITDGAMKLGCLRAWVFASSDE